MRSVRVDEGRRKVPMSAVVSGPGQGSSTPVDLDGVIDLVEDGLLGLDRDWQVRFVNSAAARLLGREAGTCTARTSGASSPLPPARSSTAATGGARVPQQVELERFCEPLGVWFSITLHPSPDGVTTVLRDVTSRRYPVGRASDLRRPARRSRGP